MKKIIIGALLIASSFLPSLAEAKESGIYGAFGYQPMRLVDQEMLHLTNLEIGYQKDELVSFGANLGLDIPKLLNGERNGIFKIYVRFDVFKSNYIDLFMGPGINMWVLDIISQGNILPVINYGATLKPFQNKRIKFEINSMFNIWGKKGSSGFENWGFLMPTFSLRYQF